MFIHCHSLELQGLECQNRPIYWLKVSNYLGSSKDGDEGIRWKQGNVFLAGQESRNCFVFFSDVGIRSIYLSLTLGTAKFKLLD